MGGGLATTPLGNKKIKMAKRLKLFKDSSDKFWSNNSRVGGVFTTGYTYALSYLKASDYLVDIAIKGNDADKDLIFPICFNYRHYIELSLKELIKIGEEFYKKSEYLGFEIKKYSKFKSDLLDKEHSLQKLLNWLIVLLNCISEEKINSAVTVLINDFHNIDPDGQKFRYYVNKKKKLSFPNQSFYDLAHLKVGMKRIENEFMGIDGWLDHYGTIANGLISELNVF